MQHLIDAGCASLLRGRARSVLLPSQVYPSFGAPATPQGGTCRKTLLMDLRDKSSARRVLIGVRRPSCVPPLSDTRREALEDYVGSEDRIVVAGGGRGGGGSGGPPTHAPNLWQRR